MSDVFISYSRKDSEFVHRLHAALAARNRNTWVDWEGIPLSADWWREICAGIEAADTFVFVISPDAVESPVCNLEISWALQHNKRLIPIVLTKTDEKGAFAALAARGLDEHLTTILNGRDILAVARDNWQAMVRHHWLFFSQDTDFDSTFEKLIEVIDTDLVHTRSHTRLLIRAREWQSKDKNAAYLLRGEDLLDAESWLAQSGSKTPVPTELHTQYIITSRRAANTRQRNLLIGVSVALLVSVSLAILSFGLFQQSEERGVLANHNAASATVAQGKALIESDQRGTQQKLAEYNAQTAVANLNIALNTQSQFLADLSRQQLDQDNVLAARLVALEGLSHYPNIYHQENLNAMINAYYSSGAEILRIQQSSLGGVRANKDETKLLSWGTDNTARVWDRATGKLLLFLPHPNSVESAVWNKAESLILTTSIGGAAYVWDAQTGQQVMVLRQTASTFDGMWNEDESQITTTMLVGNLFYRVTWDAHNGTLLKVEPRVTNIINPVLLTSDHYKLLGEGDYFLVAGVEDRIIVERDGKKVTQLEVPYEGVQRIGFNHDETRLMAANYVTSSDDSFVYIWDTGEDDSFTNTLRLPAPGEIQDVQWNPDGTRLAVVGLDRVHRGGFVRVWNTSSGEAQLSLTLPKGINGLTWLKDGTQLLAWSTDNIYIWDVSVLIPLDARQPFPTQRLQYSKDGKRALVAVGNVGSSDIVFDGYGILWDVVAHRSLFKLEVKDEALTRFTFSPDEKYIVGWDSVWNTDKGRNNKAHLWDAKTGEALADLSVDSGLSFANVRWFQDGLLAQTSSPDFATPNYIVFYDSKGREVRRFSFSSRVSKYILTQDESTLIGLESVGNNITVWDVHTGKKLFTLAHDGTPYTSWLSKDDTQLLVQAGKSAYVWSMKTGEQLAKLDFVQGDPRSLNLVYWSPSNRYIVTYEGNSNQATLWTTATSKPLLTLKFPLEKPVDYLYPPAWNTDETRLALSARETLLIWSLPDGKLQATYPDSGSYEAHFSPDSRYLALGWFRKFALDLQTGDHLAFDVPGRITSLRWMDSSKLEIFTDYDVRYEYQMDMAKLIKTAQDSLSRVLNNDERHEFFLPTIVPTVTQTAMPTLPLEPTSKEPLLLTALVVPTATPFMPLATPTNSQ